MMYREVRGLHQAAYVLAVFTFGSQLLALLRDRILAGHFGAGPVLDIYYAAFKIPDLLFALFASSLSVYVLIPFVAARIKGEDSTEASQLLAQVMSVFLMLYTALAALIFVAAPFLVPLLFPGVDAGAVTFLLRILLLQPFFLGLSSLFGVVTQLGHRFILYAISPLLYNVGIIFGIVVLYPVFGIAGLAWGVVLGAFCHMAIQIPLVRQSPLAFGLTTHFSWSTLRQIVTVSVPRALTLALGQLVLLVLISIASMMTVGSVAIFQFAYNLQSVPLAVIGASYSIAAFPILADHFAKAEFDAFRLHITTVLRHIIFWCVPTIGLVVVLRAQIVRVILGSGAFNWNDTRLTAAVLALLIISLVAQSINLLLIRSFYAGGQTRTPFMVASVTSLLTIALAGASFLWYSPAAPVMHWLTGLLRINAVSGAEVVLIALSYTIGAILQTLLLLRSARQHFQLPLRWLVPFFGTAVMAGVVGGASAYVMLNFLVGGINEDRFVGILIQGLLGGFVGIAGVIATYYIFGSAELSEIYKAIHGRVFRATVVSDS